jgi:hypothetical protein
MRSQIADWNARNLSAHCAFAMRFVCKFACNQLGGNAMKMIALTVSVIGLTAIAMGGCDNALNQPQPGQTPTASAAPSQNAAGAPLVPANNPPPGSATPRWNH